MSFVGFPEKATPEEAVAKTQAGFRKILKHPWVPKTVERKLEAMIPKVELVSDEAIREFALSHSTLNDIPIQLYDPSTLRADAFTDYQFGSNVPPRILVRRNYLAQDITAQYFLKDLLAEQFSIGLRTDKRIPIDQIPDGSLLMKPYNTKQKLIDYLRQSRIFQLGQMGEFNPEQIVAQVSGFQTIFAELNPQSDSKTQESPQITYLLSHEQRDLERARTAIMQTILECLYIGITEQPKNLFVDQFKHGQKVIAEDSKMLLPLFAREIGAMRFINAYTNNQPATKAYIAPLLESLLQKTPGDFLKDLPKPARVTFKRELLDWVELDSLVRDIRTR